MTAAPLIRICGVSDIRMNEPLALSAEGIDVVVARTQSGLRAFEGRCPHEGALLGEGEIIDGKLVCRNHRWRFNVDTGERDGGSECIKPHPVSERDGGIFVDLSTVSRPLKRGDAKRTLSDLPGPKGLPVIGNFHQLDRPNLHLILERWAELYGPMYLYRMGPRETVAISDHTLNEQVLRARPDTFRRLGNLGPAFAEIGMTGVFSAEGDAWRAQRKLATSALAQRNIRALYPKLQTVIGRLKLRWEKLADAGAAVDILEEMKRFTVDVATLITFGYDVNSIEQGGDVIQRKLELVFPALSRRLFSLFPTWRFVRLPQDRRLDRAVAELRSWMNDLVAAERDRLSKISEPSEKPTNFLQAMLSARDDEGRPFSDEVIFGNLMTMLAAGEDTTANTLGWAVHHLCDDPEWVAALRREADDVLGKADQTIDIDAASKLVVAGAVADEAMRLRPVAPLLIFQSKMETVIGDLLVPAGTTVAVLSRPAARKRENFAAPETFQPRRWLGGATGAHNVSASIPFGSGPRICPGRVHAILEMKLILSMLYKHFDVERVGAAAEVKEELSFAMTPVGIKVRLRRRSGGEQLQAAALPSILAMHPEKSLLQS
jgi:cytochrome P450/nitrite reductase/ring-hydroxylating ferredoxin subunit